jgi:hypothetical protein
MYPITKGDILKVRVITNILVVEHLIKQTFNFYDVIFNLQFLSNTSIIQTKVLLYRSL